MDTLADELRSKYAPTALLAKRGMLHGIGIIDKGAAPVGGRQPPTRVVYDLVLRIALYEQKLLGIGMMVHRVYRAGLEVDGV